jgi:hypothetical protein
MTEIVPLTRARIDDFARGRPHLEPITAAPPQVYVLFTTVEETLRAVRIAGRLAGAIGGRVTVIHLRSVGFGAPLDHPTGLSPVETEAFKARLAAEDGDARARVCLCRNPRQALRSVIDRHSLIVLGGRRGWWPTPSHRWRRVLEEEGYVVVLANEAIGERQSDG